MSAIASDAERMDRHYRYQRFIYDSTRTHYLIGRKYLIRQIAPEPGQSVLEIGCGTAWNLVRIAKRYPRARVFGIDVSRAMLQTAASSLARHGLSGQVQLSQGDATNFDPKPSLGSAQFDRIIFSYALSMIPRWQDALSHSAGLLAPGGALHIVDFGQCDALPTVFKRGLFAFLKHYTVVPRADLSSVARKIADDHGLALRIERLHRGYTDYLVLSRP